jgi:hypothetical protein
MRRAVPIAVMLLVMASGTGGCYLNSPSHVTKRFIKAMSRLDWGRMEELVDWSSSERAFGRPLGNHKQTLQDAAEGITGFDISYEGDERSRTRFLYLKVSETTVSDRTDSRATVTATVSLGAGVENKVVFTTTKVGRTWRVVLTPSLPSS